jgi:hypothetical protein
MNSVEDWSEESPLQVGQRVRIIRDPDWPGPWPNEPLGVIEPIFGKAFSVVNLKDSSVNVPDSDRRMMREYLVQFDEPQNDTSGDGPYSSAVIWEKYVTPFGDISLDSTDEQVPLRTLRDEALRQAIESPENGRVISRTIDDSQRSRDSLDP